MTPFFRGRSAVFLAALCAAAMISADTATASGSLAGAAQPTGTSDGPPVYSADSDGPSYNCQKRDTVADTIAECDQVKKKNRSQLWKIALALIIAGIIAYLLSRTRFSSGRAPPSHDALLENGPELPTSFPDGSFSVRGFARDGWPIVVDFEPQPGTVTQLEVTVPRGNRQTTRTLILDPDGTGGRQLIKLEMPDAGADQPTPATYFVSSLPIAQLDADQPQSVNAIPLKVYGIGGGPSAVGSVAIERVNFDRADVGARFGFVAKSQFSRARAQIQRLRAGGTATEIVPVFEARASNVSLGSHGGSWPGMAPGSSAPSRGPHRLQVTAWFTTDDRSWVAALAPDIVVQ